MKRTTPLSAEIKAWDTNNLAMHFLSRHHIRDKWTLSPFDIHFELRIFYWWRNARASNLMWSIGRIYMKLLNCYCRQDLPENSRFKGYWETGFGLCALGFREKEFLRRIFGAQNCRNWLRMHFWPRGSARSQHFAKSLELMSLKFTERLEWIGYKNWIKVLERFGWFWRIVLPKGLSTFSREDYLKSPSTGTG